MNRGIVELIDTVELAVSRSRGCAPRTVVSEAHRRVDGLRNRNGHFGEVLVVALAGGTGAGKSSVLNAIAGEDVAGVRRDEPSCRVLPADEQEGQAHGLGPASRHALHTAGDRQAEMTLRPGDHVVVPRTMYYGTARWLEALDGGIEYLKRVIVGHVGGDAPDQLPE